MTRKKKLLDKAFNNPEGMSFNEFCTVMRHQGWTLDHQRGSHQIWYSPKAYRLSVQNKDGQAKGYQVKQFLARLTVEGEKHA